MKIKATIKNGEVVPECHYCKNYDGKEYRVERIEKINFINVDYAVLINDIVKPTVSAKIQTWIDLKTSNYTPELLTQFL